MKWKNLEFQLSSTIYNIEQSDLEIYYINKITLVNFNIDHC